jgi:hypothetical protein
MNQNAHIPSNYEEYLLWHLEGNDIGDLLSSVNAEWIAYNFSWLLKHGIINRIVYMRNQEQIHINVYINNAVATYNASDYWTFCYVKDQITQLEPGQVEYVY